MNSKAGTIIWCAVIITITSPLILAGYSPLLQWRDPVYIIAGFAGVVALLLLLLQPLLASGNLPGVNRVLGKRIHQYVGSALLLTILIHITGLWITSPPDVIDALLLRSATPFSIWGVVALWGVLATSILAVVRKSLPIKPRTWRIAHKTLATVIVTGSIVHAILIEGTMEVTSKYILCILVSVATIMAITNTSLTKINFPPKSENR